MATVEVKLVGIELAENGRQRALASLFPLMWEENGR
jgi:hypothetical protein